MKKKFVLGITALICLAICLLTPSLFKITEEDEALYNAYRHQTYRDNTMSATSIVAVVANEKDSAESSSSLEFTGHPGLAAPDGWIDILDAVHKVWGSQGGYYGLGHYENMTLWGEQVKVRWDCSGYVGYCVYKFGKTTKSYPFTSADRNNGDLYGCTVYTPGTDIRVPDDLVCGDIIFYSGHVEVFYSLNQSNSEKPIVYNWGGAASAQNKYHDSSGNLLSMDEIKNVKSTGTSHYKYSDILKVWRFN